MITGEQIRTKMDELDLTVAQVHRAINVGSKGWIGKALMPNDRYKFDEPNQERMEIIWGFLEDYEKLIKKWKQ